METNALLTANSFRLLKPANKKNNSFILEVRVTGYNDTMHYIAHLIKVSIMALEGKDSFSSPYIPEPEVNISSMLELVLNMIPYEESELLDVLYQAHLNGVSWYDGMSDEELGIRIVPPMELRN
jgi:hypothetical protein